MPKNTTNNIYQSIYHSQSIYLSIYSVYIYQSITLFLSIYFVNYLSIYLSINQSLFISIYLSIDLSLYISIYPFQSLHIDFPMTLASEN